MKRVELTARPLTYTKGRKYMPNLPGVEPTFRVDDIARHLGVTDDTIYKRIAAGDLRAIRVGRVLRVPRSALTDFIAGRALVASVGSGSDN